ncbi:flavodoxin [Sulfuricurvum sp.]|uniref:flavodoxin n=1 Tax=Sulfuricurvum sp. TaxID=2025608 RepID=UPI002621B111|nr:flavodoxin [Sulfuricurvum sp.]MDD3596536.1 flavodoxin [Sulfuricurvum sp.]
MSKIALVYGSSTGNTEKVAISIQNQLHEHQVDLYNVQNCGTEFYIDYKNIIFGVSTWGEGDLQDDWESYENKFLNIDLKGKTVALFGLGDQEEYSDNYLDAMGTLYDIVLKNGARVVGMWTNEGYEFNESTALRDGKFVGLALDEDNQSKLTNQRVTQWLGEILPSFG